MPGLKKHRRPKGPTRHVAGYVDMLKYAGAAKKAEIQAGLNQRASTAVAKIAIAKPGRARKTEPRKTMLVADHEARMADVLANARKNDAVAREERDKLRATCARIESELELGRRRIDAAADRTTALERAAIWAHGALLATGNRASADHFAQLAGVTHLVGLAATETAGNGVVFDQDAIRRCLQNIG